MPPPDLKQLAIGDRVQDPLLVLEIEQRESARGGFTTLTLGNCHGQLATAPFWAEDQPRIAGSRGAIVAQVIGEVGQYNGRRQLKVSSIRVLPRGTSRLAPAPPLGGRGGPLLGHPRPLAWRGPAAPAPAHARPVLRR